MTYATADETGVAEYTCRATVRASQIDSAGVEEAHPRVREMSELERGLACLTMARVTIARPTSSRRSLREQKAPRICGSEERMKGLEPSTFCMANVS
jgi:hypothetical protein